MKVGQDACIRIRSEGNRAVTEDAAHGLEIRARRKQERGASVPEAVESPRIYGRVQPIMGLLPRLADRTPCPMRPAEPMTVLAHLT